MQQHNRQARHHMNQYLVDHFVSLKKKMELRGQQSQGNRMVFTYEKIIKSLVRYPLPLLSERQAVSLNGIGDKIASIIMNKVRKQYSEYIRDARDLEEEDDEARNIDNADQMRDFRNQMQEEEDVEREQEVINQEIQSQFVAQNLNNNDNNQRRGRQFDEESEIELQGGGLNVNARENNETKKKRNISVLNANTSNNNNQKKTKKYKPAEKTNPWNILVALYCFSLQKNKMLASRKEIKEIANDLKDQGICGEVKHFTGLGNLREKGLIEQYQISNEERSQLTEEGKEMASQFYNDKINAMFNNSNQNSVNNNRTDNIMQEDQEDSNDDNARVTVEESKEDNDMFSQFKFKSNNNNGRNRKKKNLSSIQEGNENQNEDNNNMNEDENDNDNNENNEDVEEQPKKMHQVIKGDIEGCTFFLLIDKRERRDKADDNDYFATQVEQYGVQCDSTPLPIGDFLWTVQIDYKDEEKKSEFFLLDTIVERKTGDDLAASILDKRYKDQKNRLKATGLKNVIYLIEGTVSNNSGLSQSIVDNAATSSSIKDKIKIKKTINMQETVKYLCQMSLCLRNRFYREYNAKGDDEMFQFQYNFEEFEQQHRKHSQITVQKQLGYMINTIKGSGDQQVQQIIDSFQTPFGLYSGLENLKKDCLEIKRTQKRKKDKDLIDIIQQELPQRCKNGSQDQNSQGIRKISKNIITTILNIFCDIKSMPSDQVSHVLSQDPINNFSQTQQNSNNFNNDSNTIKSCKSTNNTKSVFQKKIDNGVFNNKLNYNNSEGRTDFKGVGNLLSMPKIRIDNDQNQQQQQQEKLEEEEEENMIYNFQYEEEFQDIKGQNLIEKYGSIDIQSYQQQKKQDKQLFKPSPYEHDKENDRNKDNILDNLIKNVNAILSDDDEDQKKQGADNEDGDSEEIMDLYQDKKSKRKKKMDKKLDIKQYDYQSMSDEINNKMRQNSDLYSKKQNQLDSFDGGDDDGDSDGSLF